MWRKSQSWQAHSNTGEQLLAAKVYRPRQFRNLRNDKASRFRQVKSLLSSGRVTSRAAQTI
jgi:hypothetical protein